MFKKRASALTPFLLNEKVKQRQKNEGQENKVYKQIITSRQLGSTLWEVRLQTHSWSNECPRTTQSTDDKRKLRGLLYFEAKRKVRQFTFYRIIWQRVGNPEKVWHVQKPVTWCFLMVCDACRFVFSSKESVESQRIVCTLCLFALFYFFVKHVPPTGPTFHRINTLPSYFIE